MGQAFAWPFFCLWVRELPRAFHPKARSHGPITVLSFRLTSVAALLAVQLPHGDWAMRCGFGVKTRAMLKNGSSFRLAIFLFVVERAFARLSPQSPVTWPNHRAQFWVWKCFGCVGLLESIKTVLFWYCFGLQTK